jgi:hypothetical protein
MTGRNRCVAIAGFFFLGCAQLALANSFDLGFTTTGKASANAGDRIQIGYSFTNDNPSWWAVVSNISASLPPSNLIECSECFDPRAKFLVDPLSTLSSPTGLIDFSWATAAPPGYSFTGPISAQVVWVPFNPTIPMTGFWTVVSRNASASYQAEVNGTPADTVPEPGTLAIAAAGRLGLWGWLRRGKP